MLKRVLVSCAVLIGVAAIGACGGTSGSSLPVKPQIVTDRDTIVDTMFVNQTRQETVQVTDKGQQDLVVSGYSLSNGNGVITLVNQAIIQPDGTSSNTVKSNQTGFITMQCKPTSAGAFTGTLTIQSNAENNPTKTVAITCNGQ
jgi:hypothetical protein